MPRHLAVTVLALFVGSSAWAGLPEYMKKPEPDFTWKLEKNDKLLNGTVYTIRLVSQNWQGIKWEHKLLVLQPKDIKPANTMPATPRIVFFPIRISFHGR